MEMSSALPWLGPVSLEGQLLLGPFFGTAAVVCWAGVAVTGRAAAADVAGLAIVDGGSTAVALAVVAGATVERGAAAASFVVVAGAATGAVVGKTPAVTGILWGQMLSLLLSLLLSDLLRFGGSLGVAGGSGGLTIRAGGPAIPDVFAAK